MIKVRILDFCEFCDGEAYIFVCEDVDANGQTFDRYHPYELSGRRSLLHSLLAIRRSTSSLASVAESPLRLSLEKPRGSSERWGCFIGVETKSESNAKLMIMFDQLFSRWVVMVCLFPFNKPPPQVNP